MKEAVFAGTFDPFTKGHEAVLARASLLFDHVTVAVCEKSKSGVSAVVRAAIAKKSAEKIRNASVEIFGGLLTDYMKKKRCRILVRGLRGAADFEYEKQLFLAYKSMMPEIEVCYLVADGADAYVSSSLVREILALNGDASAYIDSEAAAEIRKEYGAEK